MTVARIENRAHLTDHGDQQLRDTILDLAEVALAALSPSSLACAGRWRWTGRT